MKKTITLTVKVPVIRIPPRPRGKVRYEDRRNNPRDVPFRIETSAVMKDRRKHGYHPVWGKDAMVAPLQGRIVARGLVRRGHEDEDVLREEFKVFRRAARARRHRVLARQPPPDSGE
jgi:hypothetical protein